MSPSPLPLIRSIAKEMEQRRPDTPAALWEQMLWVAYWERPYVRQLVHQFEGQSV